MADNKQTPTTEEHIPPEAAGPEIPGAAPGDVVVDIGTIDELMKKRNAAARDAVELTAEEQSPDLPAPGEEDTREPWEKTQDELNAENKKPRRGRPPKAAEQTGPEDEKKPEEKPPRKGRPPKADKVAPDKAAPDKAEKPVRDKMELLTKYPEAPNCGKMGKRAQGWGMEDAVKATHGNNRGLGSAGASFAEAGGDTRPKLCAYRDGGFI